MDSKQQKTPLLRPNRKRLLAGVCAALADYSHQDINYIRLIFLILTFLGGFGLILYILLWIWIPEK